MKKGNNFYRSNRVSSRSTKLGLFIRLAHARVGLCPFTTIIVGSSLNYPFLWIHRNYVTHSDFIINHNFYKIQKKSPKSTPPLPVVPTRLILFQVERRIKWSPCWRSLRANSCQLIQAISSFHVEPTLSQFYVLKFSLRITRPSVLTFLMWSS